MTECLDVGESADIEVQSEDGGSILLRELHGTEELLSTDSPINSILSSFMPCRITST